MAEKTVKKAIAKARSKHINMSSSTLVVDIDSSCGFSSHCVDASPCITRTRGSNNGHYVLPRGTRMSTYEMGALMGVRHHVITAMHRTGRSDAVIGAALGNAQSVNVLSLERLLVRLLNSLLPSLIDPSAGKQQRQKQNTA
eukprot:NODE_4970_length_625_cov_1.100000.p1 GENE.NODE_4970_length_625_cov_1.100000~~NODE_4970_length_625_cov_1.100000.p1  ORF type:complete len:141 (+),score=22.07 NODE_4970_length_625_cov_1.100000:137-559(+)